ncbi:MAG: GAF domain-containing protein [Chloroflexota bacterium]
METNRYPTFRSRLAIVLIILAALFAAIVSSILYINFKTELRNSLRRRLENITTLAGLQQNGDDLLKVQAAGDEYFEKIQTQNAKIKRSDPDLRFVYTMRKNAQGIFFVVDARISPDETLISNFGDVYTEPSDTLVKNFDSMTGTMIEPDFYSDEFGTFLSGYTPIFTSKGELAGVLGVDISANTILAQERAYLFRLLFIYSVSFILLIGLGMISANYLAKPIIGLRDVANKISKGDFNFRITDIPRTRELAELALDFNTMTENLSRLINDLEERVQERTAGITKKTDQLRAASYIARQTSEAPDLESLLDIVVNLVTGQFGFYHAGIFLLNETGEEAILQTASSEGGKRMIERGHSLTVGSQSIVGYVASHKKVRIALDVGSDAVFFNNPDLPMTRSEAALPLLIRNKVLGVLDIQSEQPQAFRVEDMDVLQTLADQVAVAIENARLLSESEAAIMQLEAVSTVRVRDAWSKNLQDQKHAFTYTPLGVRADVSTSLANESDLKTSISLRGQEIGSLALTRKDNQSWNKNDEELIREVAYQVGLAVDNLRLLEDAQQRARQEQTIGELATRFSQSMDIDGLLQTAARELGQLPDVSEVSVFIGQLPEQVPQKRRTKRTTG